MIISKLIIYSSIIGSVFIASTIVSMNISKAVNKTPIPNESELVSEEGEEEVISYIPPQKNLSDADHFISSLTSFGNLTADLDISISYANKSFSITGNAFVSLESLLNPMFNASLDIDLGFKNIHSEITYCNSTIYLSLNDNNIKLSTNNIADIFDLINLSGEGIAMPDMFSNIDANQLLTNLGKMTSNKQGDSIVYTCTLLDDIPPITFTSDSSYNMTSISLPYFEIEGFGISLYGETKILGSGHNQITNPEKDKPYIDVTSYFPIINQIKDLLNKKQLGINFDINVSRNGQLTFDTSGSLQLDFNNGINLGLSGNMINNENDKPLNSYFDIKYLDNVIYFGYNDILKFRYDKSSIADLIDIISNNSDVLPSIDNLLSNNQLLSTIPILTLIQNKDYESVLNYYNAIKISNNEIQISLKGSILDNSNDDDMIITINHNDNGISHISIKNLVIFSYKLNIELGLIDYQNITINNPESYTPLQHFNGIVNSAFNLVKQNKFALNLSGAIDNIAFNGSTQFVISDNERYGTGKINITDKNGKNHNLILDINTDNQMYFSYNGNLNGKFTLKSITDLFDLIKELALSGDERFAKYRSLLTADYSNSTIMRLLDGEIEAILYDNLLNNISYNNGDYIIDINGSFLKNNGLEDVNSIYLTIHTENGAFKGVSVNGTILNKNISISLSLTDYDESYSRLDHNAFYYDFSDIKTLASYLLNTAKCNDFSLSGHVDANLKIIGIFNKNLADIDLSAKVHIEKDEQGKEKVYVQVLLHDVPYLSTLVNKSSRWENRDLYIYFTDDLVYIHTETLMKKTKIFSKDEYHYEYQDIKLTMQEFFADVIYYLVNVGFDIDVDLSSLSGDSNRDIDFSKLLASYSFTNEGNPTWNISLNMKELTGKSEIKNLNAQIQGSNETQLLSKLNADIKIDASVIAIDANMDASLDSVQPLSSETINNIKNYIISHSGQNNKEIVTSKSDTWKQ